MTNAQIHSIEDRHRMIAEAAYYRAEQRGFAGGNPLDDWLQAEREVDQGYFKKRRYLRNSLVFL